METIILDTNFLLIPVAFKVDIFSEIERICPFSYELGIVECTKKELEDISKLHGSDKKAAIVAIGLITAKKIKAVSMLSSKTVDEALVKWGEMGAVIATQDKDLKRVLKLRGIRRIVLRKKSYLVLEGETRCITKKK